MSTKPASFPQMVELHKKLNLGSDRMQHLLQNGDLLEMMGEYAHRLSEVDRKAFRTLLTGKPRDIVIASADQEYEKSKWSPPTWWRTADQQIKRAHQLWPDITLPEPPVDFTPRTKSEVLLLHVPDAIDTLWRNVHVREDFQKNDRKRFKLDRVRVAATKLEFTQPVWVGFDLQGYGSMTASQIWARDFEDMDIAASEVLSALIQFPELPLLWHRYDLRLISLSGYMIEAGDGRKYVPCISWEDYRLTFDLHLSSYYNAMWSSPSVREC